MTTDHLLSLVRNRDQNPITHIVKRAYSKTICSLPSPDFEHFDMLEHSMRQIFYNKIDQQQAWDVLRDTGILERNAWSADSAIPESVGYNDMVIVEYFDDGTKLVDDYAFVSDLGLHFIKHFVEDYLAYKRNPKLLLN